MPILDLSYTYVNKGSPPSLVFFEIIIFKMRRAGPGAHVLKRPARRILKMMISELATEGRTRPILYLCKQGVAALFSFFLNEHLQNAARWARGPRT